MDADCDQITFESARENGSGKSRKIVDTYHLIEIATPWSFDGQYGSTLTKEYHQKVAKYQPLMGNNQKERTGYEVDQTTIIFSPTGALLKESMEELAKVSKLPRGELEIRGRCIVDAAIRGAYEQWRALGKKLALAKELRALHPEEAAQFLKPETEDAVRHWGQSGIFACRRRRIR
jgi:hypothetical protein